MEWLSHWHYEYNLILLTVDGVVDHIDIQPLTEASTNITGNDALLTEGKEIPTETPVLTDLTNNGKS